MTKNEKSQIDSKIGEAITLLKYYNLNQSEKVTLQRLLEAEYWLWSDNPDV